MKPEELMIGDWVYDKHYNGDIEPIQIHNIYGTEVNCKTERNRFDVDEIVSGTYMSDLQPIPLTPEILEKNGFIGDKNVCKTKMRDDSKDELWQCEYAWYLKNLRIKNRTNGSVARLYNIMFVHELQHALRLCGINKEIEI